MDNVRNKKFISIVLVYLLVMTILPVDFLAVKVSAAPKTVESQTASKYEILKTAMYKDFGLLVTRYGLMRVDSQKQDWIGFNNNDGINYPIAISRQGNMVYVVDISDKIISVNIENGQAKFSYLAMDDESYHENETVDRQGNAWFKLTKYGDVKKYYLMRMSLNNPDNKTVTEIGYDKEYLINAGSDSKGNTWFLSNYNGTYKLMRATYNAANNTIVTKDFPLDNVLGNRVGTNLVIDKDDNIWNEDYKNNTAIKLTLNSEDALQVTGEVKYDENGVITLDSENELWLRSEGSMEKGTTYKKLKNGKFEDIYKLPFSFYSFSIGNESNLIQAYYIPGSRSKNTKGGYAYILINEKGSPTNSVSERVQKAKELVEAAKASLAFVDYNEAYAAIVDLPEGEQTALLSQLSPIGDKVYTADIQKVLNRMGTLAANMDLENYYDLMAVIDSEVKLERNRQYLLGELTGWGYKAVFTPEVVKATNAIIEAWTKKDDASIASAEQLSENVKNPGSHKWLIDQINQIKAAK